MSSATWDPGQYLRYADERGRPFVDLVSRIQMDAQRIVDLGCGPGQLTPVLRARWPQAQITGLDSSTQMIARAREANEDPLTSYDVVDAIEWVPERPVDVIVSNAMLQWIPGHADLLIPWTEHISPGGALAFQVPGNFDAPSHRLLRRPPRVPHTPGSPGTSLSERPPSTRPTISPGSPGPAGASMPGRTTYLHVLPGEDPVFEWISGTGARPVLQALPQEVRDRFVEDYKAVLREAYPRQEHGTVLPFRRVFVVAHRTGL